MTINIGTRFPAYCTSMGRVLLAELSSERLDGYLGSAELRGFTSRTITQPAALRSIAVPIRDRSGQVVAAVNVSTHASRTTSQQVRRNLLPPLLATAARIEADLATLSVARA